MCLERSFEGADAHDAAADVSMAHYPFPSVEPAINLPSSGFLKNSFSPVLVRVLASYINAWITKSNPE